MLGRARCLLEGYVNLAPVQGAGINKPLKRMRVLLSAYLVHKEMRYVWARDAPFDDGKEWQILNRPASIKRNVCISCVAGWEWSAWKSTKEMLA